MVGELAQFTGECDDCGEYNANCICEQLRFEDWQTEQQVLAYEADERRCCALPPHDECDFCARPKHTGESNCICRECLDLAF